jgi:SdrD B-like domain/HYR domain
VKRHTDIRPPGPIGRGFTRLRRALSGERSLAGTPTRQRGGLAALTLFAAAFVLPVALLFGTPGRASANLAGAIFTSDSTCTGVDLNIYSSKDDVYIDGGPNHHKGAASLPDGSYYVQVTTPSGILLGTSVGTGNPTPVTVSGGSFASCYELSSILVKASDGTPGYDTTTNLGGEYKVWVSTVSTFDNSSTKTDNFKVNLPNTPTLSGLTCPSDMTGICNDTGQCGAAVTYQCPDQSSISGGTPPYTIVCNPPPGSFFPAGNTEVTITVTDSTTPKPLSIECSFLVTVNDCEKPVVTCPKDVSDCLQTINGSTENVGTATATDNCDTGLTPTPVRSDGKALTDPYPLGTTTITWSVSDSAGNPGSCTQTVTITAGSISGVKFYDANDNGARDKDGMGNYTESGIQGWRITLAGTDSGGNPVPAITQCTGPDGSYSFTSLPLGNYTITEALPSPWVATRPTSGNVGVTDCTSVTGPTFGNLYPLAASGGLTLGFWSNQNGQAILKAHDPAWRALINSLCLRNSNGTLFTVSTAASFSTAYSAFRSWLLNAAATNMAYMLSAQLATTELDVAYNGLGAGTLLMLPSSLASCIGAGNGVNGNTITVGTLMNDAVTSLCSSGGGYTVASSTMRSYQQCLETALDRVNNNLLPFIAAVPPPGSIPTCP